MTFEHEARRVRNWCNYFAGCCWVILLTSALDAGLVVYFRFGIEAGEKNPICLHLIEMEPEWLSVFLAGKALGTGAVIATTSIVYRLRRHLGLTVATALSMFQVGLIGYQFLF